MKKIERHKVREDSFAWAYKANEVIDAITFLQKCVIKGGMGKVDFTKTPFIELSDILTEIRALEEFYTSLDVLADNVIDATDGYDPVDENITIINVRKKASLFCLCGFEPFSGSGECVRYKNLNVIGERLLSFEIENNVAAQGCLPETPEFISGSGTNIESGEAGTTTGRVGINAIVKWRANCSYNSAGSGTLIYNRNLGDYTELTLTKIGVGPSLQDIQCNRSLQLQQQLTPGGSWGNVSNASLTNAALINSNNFTSTVTADRELTTGTFTISSTAGRLLRWRSTILITAGTTKEYFSGTFAPGESPNGPLGDLVTYVSEDLSGTLTKLSDDSCECGGSISKNSVEGQEHCECPDDATSISTPSTITGCETTYTLATTGTIINPTTSEVLGIEDTTGCLDVGENKLVFTLSEPDDPSQAIDRATEELQPLGDIESSLSELDEDCCGTGVAIYFDVCWNNEEVGGTVSYTINVYDVETDTYDEPRIVEYTFSPGIVCVPASLPMEEGKIISFDPDAYTITLDELPPP
jgi:hypothetical protein